MANPISDYLRRPSPTTTTTATGAVTGTITATQGSPSVVPLALTRTLVNPPRTYGSSTTTAVFTATASGQITGISEVPVAASSLASPGTFVYTGDVVGGPSTFNGSGTVSTSLTVTPKGTVFTSGGVFVESRADTGFIDYSFFPWARNWGTAFVTAGNPTLGADFSFDISGQGQVNWSGTRASVDNLSATFSGRKARGTLAGPTFPNSGDRLAVFQGEGWTGGSPDAYVTGAFMIAVATETWTGTANGTAWQVYTTANGTAIQTLAATFGQDQSLIIGFLPTAGTNIATLDSGGKVNKAAVGAGLTLSGGTLINSATVTASGPLGGGSATPSGTIGIASIASGGVLTGNGASAISNLALGTNLSITSGTLNASGGSGSVTSVKLASTNLAIAGTNPVTTSGTITVDLATGAGLTFGSTGTISLQTALPNGQTATTQTAGDATTKVATDAFVTTAIANAIAAVNPAVAVRLATAAILPNSPVYFNGVGGVGATITAGVTNTALVVDGVTPVLNDRILVKNEGSGGGLGAADNGVYFVSQVAAFGLAWVLTRALDYDQPSDINNTGAIPVVQGTINASTTWVLTSSVATVGTDPLTYTQFSLNPAVIFTTAGIGLTGTGTNTVSLTVPVTVADGGTGATSLTAHGVVVAEGTGAFAVTSPGTAGQALLSNGSSADPTFQTLTTGVGTSIPLTPKGRLTLTSNTPVMVADATAATSIYYTPYQGAYVPVYGGSSWTNNLFSQLTMTLDTTNQPISQVFDLFVYLSGGSPAIGAGPAWINTATVTWTSASPGVCTWTGHGLAEGAPVIFTAGTSTPTGITAGTVYYVGRSPGANSFSVATSVANAAAGTFVNTSSTGVGTQTGTNHTTTRGTGAGTTQIDISKGLWTNTNSITLTNGAGAGTAVSANQATYIGSFYTTAAGQTGMQFDPSAASGGSNTIVGLFNAYNRTKIVSSCRESTATWTTASSTYNALNASVGNRITWLDGLAQLFVSFVMETQSANAISTTVAIGINVDATNGTPPTVAQFNFPSANIHFPYITVMEKTTPLLGLHYAQQMQASLIGTSTLEGKNGRQQQNFLADMAN